MTNPSRPAAAPYFLTLGVLLLLGGSYWGLFLAPGEAYEYTSFSPLATPVGTMEGHYVMELAGSGERFEARIAPFTLAVPGAVN